MKNLSESDTTMLIELANEGTRLLNKIIEKQDLLQTLMKATSHPSELAQYVPENLREEFLKAAEDLKDAVLTLEKL